MAIGHPFGATGTRYVLTLATALRERNARYGSGHGDAVVLENPNAGSRRGSATTLGLLGSTVTSKPPPLSAWMGRTGASSRSDSQTGSHQFGKSPTIVEVATSAVAEESAPLNKQSTRWSGAAVGCCGGSILPTAQLHLPTIEDHFAEGQGEAAQLLTGQRRHRQRPGIGDDLHERFSVDERREQDHEGWQEIHSIASIQKELSC